MQLDGSNARLYRKVVPVKAFHVRNGATYHFPFGDIFYEGSHWALIQGHSLYGIAEEDFDATYEPVPGEPDTYRKTVPVWARRMDAPFSVQSKEGPEHGQAGDYIVQNQGSLDQQIVPGKGFEEMYERL